MKKFYALLILVIAIFFVLSNCQSFKKQNKSSVNFINDSIVLAYYKRQIASQFIDSVTLYSDSELDSILWEDRIHIRTNKTIRTPKDAFRIYTFEVESCGAYCNSEWYSMLHFPFENKMRSTEINLNSVDTIHELKDGTYLIIDQSSHRPASVNTIYCENTYRFVLHPESREESFTLEKIIGFCQENGVELEENPKISYDSKSQILHYQYGNNYAYSHGVDVDTIRKGAFKFINGRFERVFEDVRVLVRNPE